MASRKPTSTEIAKTAETVGAAAVCVGAAIMFVASPELRRKLAERLGHLESKLPSSKPAEPSSVPHTNKGRPTSGGEGVVYLLQAGPFYKIGKAQDFAKRLSQIKLQLPYAIEVVHKIPCNDISHVERYWHKRFASKRQNGEWFILTEADVAEFKANRQM